jgi:hypothetical protein
MPEGAANPATTTPRHRETVPTEWTLYDGHLTAECSILHNGAPACPACLREQLTGH